MGPFRAIRVLGNSFGFAWWAKIETQNPNTTYWFGPFLTQRSLRNNVPIFLDDLTSEGIESITHDFVRCRRIEPLTL
ncbi:MULTISPECIES: DUF1816 domain-containing protein [Prochlorococcus]|uniref:DUF1816 domain-containing protein n=1 Tax=Prochlorococcus marinus (strain SARG / CCMP1375 / SS120) TaxID=167539 RepID=Q7VCJ1_PROMA|nr:MULTISPECIES: DUF1816 domain-containing protein [Prochlorococcus]AAP99793.1 Uncharacterized protein Pro_0749 [Prochlorococcus marinus subsp. marinus str. CCMP1375]KGG11862.1 hypothetical protein EV04_0887 [Prochlorococcus marinus str. LG]KGG21831.1 hypothetical protein EV08_0436 [Prochlorococcus marinus str. SS2]KGG23738.1 hypothetical protein EV09_1363 [Prochlorococcus marinus str. SS35]KGG32026.1 hypothetical protein EV10_1140 [Prochlorococcus marinus str. SS51]